MSERELQLALKWWVAEKDLADVLAAVLDTCFTKEGVFMYEEDTPMPQVVAVLARWREARKS